MNKSIFGNKIIIIIIIIIISKFNKG